MIKLRPSSAEKWVNCPASAKLEQGYPDTQNKSMSEGVYAHEVAEWCLKNNTLTAFSPYTISAKGMGKHIDNYLNYINCVSKGKKLFIEYSVSLKSFGINHYGKIDTLCITPSEMHIIDFKYGKSPVNAFNNYQLLMYAYGVFSSKALVFNNLKSITLSIFQPRIEVPLSSWILNTQEFIEYVQPIKNAIVQAKSDDPAYNPGKHCMFCKAKHICPAKPKGIEFKPKVTFEDESYV